MKPLELVVPGLCGPLPDLEGLNETPVTTSLARWLARADRYTNPVTGFHPELATLFGLTETTPLPSAALCRLAHDYPVAQGNWLHADPVHLLADMDHAILRDSRSMDITAAETTALVEEINSHFRDDDIYLHAHDNNNWFLNAGQRRAVSTTPLHDVIGRNVNFFLPDGDDARFFKSFLNEVQMLLHNSRVNQQREQSGRLPVNSLWLWGEGSLPAKTGSPVKHVFSNHAMVKGLSMLSDAGFHSLDQVLSALENTEESASALVVNDALFNLACYGDVRAWQNRLETFFKEWFEPVLSQAMKNKKQVQLYPCNGRRYLISPANRYRFFRRVQIREHISLDAK